MSLKMKKLSVLIIAAVLLVAMAFAGAASAVGDAPSVVLDDNYPVSFYVKYGDVYKLNETATNVSDVKSQYGSGKTAYAIRSASELQGIEASNTNIYILTQDIYCTTPQTASIIGTFTGTLIGNGHTIYNLTINGNADNIGLVGTLGTSGTLNYVNLTCAKISSGYNRVGGLVGCANSASNVIGCMVMHSDVTGNANVGGLVGNVYASASLNIQNCSVENSSISSVGCSPGGLVGGAENSARLNVLKCSVKNCVISSDSTNVGGLVGYAASANIKFDTCNAVNCMVSSNVNDVGGLVGYVINTPIFSECSAENCTVSGRYDVGGLVGYAGSASFNGCTAKYCAVAGTQSTVNPLAGSGTATGTPEPTAENVIVDKPSGSQIISIYNGNTHVFTRSISISDPVSFFKVQGASYYSNGTDVNIKYTILGAYGSASGFGYYKPTFYTVTYNGNGNESGSVPAGTMLYLANKMVTVLGNTNNLAKPGYNFTGWNMGSVSGELKQAGNTFTITENTEFFANWTANVTNFKYVNETDIELSGISPDTVTYNATVSSATVPTRTGYTFTGWNISGTDTQLFNETGVPQQVSNYINESKYWVNSSLVNGSTLTLKTSWTANVTVLNLTDSLGASFAKRVETYGKVNSTTVSPLPTKTHFIFKGWNVSDNPTVQLINATGHLQSDKSGYTDATGAWENSTLANNTELLLVCQFVYDFGGSVLAGNSTVTETADGVIIALTNDISGPVTIPDDWGNVTLQMNGRNITTVSTNATSGDGEPGIIFVHNGSIGTNLTIANIESSGGYIIGADGIDATSTKAAGDGGAGITANATALQCTLKIESGVTVQAGAGGDGFDADGNRDGGDGGSGIDNTPSGLTAVNIIGGSVIGGNGGNGVTTTDATAGGNGGNGGNATAATATVTGGLTKGGNGGNGGASASGNGGNGGDAGKKADGDASGSNGTHGLPGVPAGFTATIDAEGNVTITLTAQSTVTAPIIIPDTWGNVTLNLGGKTITGTDGATANEAGHPALVFNSTGSGSGTNLTITNGKLIGGNGYAGSTATASPGDGGPAVNGTSPNGRLIIGQDAELIGGNGGISNDPTTNSGNSGNGGSGISGTIADGITVKDNGKVTGGTGGNGAAGTGSTAGGTAGNGGAGIDAVTSPGGLIVDDSAEVTGGVGGNGGSSVDGSAGAGGNGGVGSATSPTTVDGGKVSGGDGGNGGSSVDGNAGAGGNGGVGSSGSSTTVNNGEVSGGNGGSGGSSTGSGDAGAGGAGGSGANGTNQNVDVESNGKVVGGNGGDGGSSNSGTAGDGGEGADPIDPKEKKTGDGVDTAGNGGNGGDTKTGTVGKGGNGGTNKDGQTGTSGSNGSVINPSSPSYSSSSSRHTGYTTILQEVPTTTPTVAPTSATPSTPSAPSASSGQAAQPTQSSPAPVAGIIAGLGAAALVLSRLRK